MPGAQSSFAEKKAEAGGQESYPRDLLKSCLLASPGKDQVSWGGGDFPLNKASEQRDKIMVITEGGGRAPPPPPRGKAWPAGASGESEARYRRPSFESSSWTVCLGFSFIRLFLQSLVGVNMFLKAKHSPWSDHCFMARKIPSWGDWVRDAACQSTFQKGGDRLPLVPR